MKAQTYQAAAPVPLEEPRPRTEQEAWSLRGKRPGTRQGGLGRGSRLSAVSPGALQANQGGNKGRRGQSRLPGQHSPRPREQMGPWALLQARASPAGGALRLSREKEK